MTSLNGLSDILAKAGRGERLTFEDGIRLFESHDLLAIGQAADLVRRRKVGDKAYFIQNRHINHTNVCRNMCKLCAFAREPGQAGAYTMSLDEIEEKARECRGLDINEVHIVGGLHPDLPFEYYEEMMSRVGRHLPDIHIQAFTAVEIDYFAEISGLSVEEVLRRLQSAGLGSLPGGGAEVFSARVRERICDRKISGESWLAVHRAAHRIGMRSNATMLYGHVETYAERVEHMLKLRDLQDETGGFMTFIPLAFHPANTPLAEERCGVTGSAGMVLPVGRTTGFDDLKTLAVARLMLDNFPHIKAFWIMIGLKLAQISLAFGVDDLDGTVQEERITHAAGADTSEYTPARELIDLIRGAGRVPVERDTLYNVVRHW